MKPTSRHAAKTSRSSRTKHSNSRRSIRTPFSRKATRPKIRKTPTKPDPFAIRLLRQAWLLLDSQRPSLSDFFRLVVLITGTEAGSVTAGGEAGYGIC
ncbi:hypothetical protein HYPGJ_20677 [Hyphomicrobium sp. GJ21]|nr:hypothetical protein HYPGJ_20677 [Hyphomicrobium sp. GJ21]